MSEHQGIRTDGCIHCRLLYPDGEAPCPKCGGRTTFVPAQMLCEDSIRERVRDEVRSLHGESDPSRRRGMLLALLDSLFVYGSIAIDEAAAGGADLATLRRMHELD